MEGEKAKGGDADFPWMSCVMGCRPAEDKEVILLKCLHVICSLTCKENWKKQLTSKEGSQPDCLRCRMLKEEDLEQKVILKKVFPPKLMKDDVKLVCDMCIDELPATTYCPTCPQYLCEICTKNHSRYKSTFNHNLETNLDQRREIEFQRMLEKQNFCKVEGHAASRTTKYCITCQQKLCDQCTMHDESHKILETQKGKELFISNLEVAKKLYKKVEESIEKTQNNRSEFSPQKYLSISSKISDEFALLNFNFARALKKCQELTIEEVLKTFERRRTDLSDLEARLEFMKKNIAQMCKAYESVHDNLDESATSYFSHLASECTDFLSNVFAEILKDGQVDIVEDSNQFSLDPKFMKSVLSLLENGPVKFQSGLDLKNMDETASVSSALLNGSTPAQDFGLGATSEKDIIVTSVFSLNPSASSAPKSQGIARKSTGYGKGRHLGVPHLERRPSLNQSPMTSKPATTPSSLEPFSMNGKRGPTDPVPNRKPAIFPPAKTPATSITLPVLPTCSVIITPIHSASATSTLVAATTPCNTKSNEALSAESSQTTAFQINMTAKQKKKQNLNNVTSHPGSSITVTASEGKVSMENGRHTSTEQVSKETADKMEVDSPSKTNGVKENERKDNGTVTVQSPGISPNGTSLSDSSDNVVTVRVGLRNRKKRIYQDCVDPAKDIIFRNEDTEDAASSVSLSQGLDDTWSENGFESETESVLSAPLSRRQSPRKRGDSSASGPSTPALGKLARDKKKGKGVRPGKMKRTWKRQTNDDSVSDDGGPDKRRRKRGSGSHIRSTISHLGEKFFRCETCSKIFLTKGRFEVHQRSHAGEKQFLCSFCNKSFNHRSGLIVHERTHTGEKPYRCEICDQNFSRKHVLEEHIISKHNPTLKPFSCVFCEMRFVTNGTLFRHLRAHNTERPYICRICHKEFCQPYDLSRHVKKVHKK